MPCTVLAIDIYLKYKSATLWQKGGLMNLHDPVFKASHHINRDHKNPQSLINGWICGKRGPLASRKLNDCNYIVVSARVFVRRLHWLI